MLVDTFMFYNELDLLELRLTLLDEYVDRFVLVESEVNHTGGSKRLFFEENKERFEKWLPKIHHVIVTAEESPNGEDPWSREKYQRHCILRGLDGVPDDALVMVSDADEIPDLEKIPWENMQNVVSVVHMWMFQYSCDYVFTGEPWFGTVITTAFLFKKFEPNYFRTNRWKFPVHTYSGWHLSSFGNGEHVANKVNTFAHSKDPHDIEWTPEVIQGLIDRGICVDGKTQLVRHTDDVPLPAPLEVLIRLRLIHSPN